MYRVVHFEIAADDPARAVEFYSRVFGWKIEKWGGPVDYWLTATGKENEPGINGAIARRQDWMANVVDTIEVPSVDDSLIKITGADGKVIAPKMAVPGVGYVAYFQDTEGNVMGLIQSDPSAQ